MKSIKRGFALLLVILLIFPSISVSAAATDSVENAGASKQTENEKAAEYEEAVKDEEDSLDIEIEADEVVFNTGAYSFSVVSEEAFENGFGDSIFSEDGSYTINIPEENPYFPYEVQFTYKGETINEWFMSPDDSVEVGGHKFYVTANFDNTIVTQMSLNVAGNTVVVYPEEKKFTNDNGVQPMSLLPLEERRLNVDLSGYTPAELTMVSIDSIFMGENALTDTSKVLWKISDGENYTVSSSGDKLDLSIRTFDNSGSWEMIVGEDDQLASRNIRYRININTTASENWLIPVVYVQDEQGRRKNISLTDSSYRDYNENDRMLHTFLSYKEAVNHRDFFVSLSINPSFLGSLKSDHFRIYNGKFKNPAEAIDQGQDITNIICSEDMTQENAGYKISLRNNYTYLKDITIVTYDAKNNVIGCLPIGFLVSTRPSRIDISLYKNTEDGRKDVVAFYDSENHTDGSIEYTAYLYKGYAADDGYSFFMSYFQNGMMSNSEVTAAYEGKYTTIAQAEESGAIEIKNTLFNDNDQSAGYIRNYANGICFTVFVGTDETEGQEVYQYYFKTVETDNTEEVQNSSPSFSFGSFRNDSGKILNTYMVDEGADSYADFNYLTVFVGADADITNLAPEFQVSPGANLYTEGSSAPEVSGKSFHDFSKGPVQYTVTSEDGSYAKNYWLQVVKPVSGVGQLYINSLSDPNSDTKEENGIIYSTREIMLKDYHDHDHIHDVLLANIGTEAIPSLSVELESNVLELDDYWTLKGVHELSGFRTVSKDTAYGELPNLAKIRLKVKDNVESGEVSGTLTIKSGKNVLMVLNLTGTIGTPSIQIITKEIPEAVKYVPYGVIIQNNNKYSWNQVSYELKSGTLPNGMVLKPNGEIYGVPKEVGKFTFTVGIQNSYYLYVSDEATYTLTINENTDENIEAVTDAGYKLSQRVQDIYLVSGDMTTQTLISQGNYHEFVALYLDGKELTKGQDYTVESGSTRILISNSVLGQAYTKDNEIHTLVMEFRTQDGNVLKRAAQNFRIYDNKDSGNDGDGGNTGNNGNPDNNQSSGNNSISGSTHTGTVPAVANSSVSAASGTTANGGQVTTGDNAQPVIYIALICASAFAAVSLFCKKRKAE